MSFEASSKLPVSRVFWALMAVSLVTFLVGTSPDDTSKYKAALKELHEIQKISRGVNSIYKFVESDVAKQLSDDPINALSEVIQMTGRKPISKNILPNIEYFWIDQGPLDIPEKINDLYEMFQKDINYKVRAPSIIQLKEGVSDILKNAPSKFRLVSDIDIACNYANLRCKVSMTLHDNEAESTSYHKEFKIDAILLDLEKSTFWSKVINENSYFNKETITLQKIGEILYEVYDLDIDQAVKQLNIKLSSAKGDVSALGISIKGTSTLSVLPFLIFVLMLSLLVVLRELGNEYDKSHYLDTPLFFQTNLGISSKWATFVAFPVLSVVVLVIRFFDIHSLGSWLGGLSMVGILVCSWLISTQLIKIQQNESNERARSKELKEGRS